MQNNTRATLLRAAVPVQALLLFMAGDALWVFHNAPLPLLVFAGLPITLAVAVAAISIAAAPLAVRPGRCTGPSARPAAPAPGVRPPTL